jgi:hypothetical protein
MAKTTHPSSQMQSYCFQSDCISKRNLFYNNTKSRLSLLWLRHRERERARQTYSRVPEKSEGSRQKERVVSVAAKSVEMSIGSLISLSLFLFFFLFWVAGIRLSVFNIFKEEFPFFRCTLVIHRCLVNFDKHFYLFLLEWIKFGNSCL